MHVFSSTQILLSHSSHALKANLQVVVVYIKDLLEDLLCYKQIFKQIFCFAGQNLKLYLWFYIKKILTILKTLYIVFMIILYKKNLHNSYFIGFGLFCTESLLSIWVIQVQHLRPLYWSTQSFFDVFFVFSFILFLLSQRSYCNGWVYLWKMHLGKACKTILLHQDCLLVRP